MKELKRILDNLIGLGVYENMLANPDDYISIFDKRFILSDLNISARVLNHWKDYGLLPDGEIDKDADKEVEDDNEGPIKRRRNKFNFFELMYLYILQDLRKFGFPLKKLKIVKDALLDSPNLLELIKEITDSDIQGLEKLGFDVSDLHELFRNRDEIVKNSNLIPPVVLNAPVLSFAILGVIISKVDLKLVITGEGDVSFELTNSIGQVAKTFYNSQPHIVLPLYNYLYHFLSHKKYKEFYVMYKLLNDQELYILEQVRNDRYTEIKINMIKGDTITLELTEKLKLENTARLQEVLLKGEYQDLIVKTESGEIRYSTIKTKKRI